MQFDRNFAYERQLHILVNIALAAYISGEIELNGMKNATLGTEMKLLHYSDTESVLNEGERGEKKT